MSSISRGRLLCASGPWRIGATLCGEAEQGFENLPRSLMAKAFDSKFVRPGFKSQFGYVLMKIPDKDEPDAQCFHDFLMTSWAPISQDGLVHENLN